MVAIEPAGSPNAAVFALHDAKNMLGVLTANVDYLSAELGAADAGVAGALEDLRVSTSRLAELLRAALGALRGSRERPRARSIVRVAPLLDAAATRFRRKAEAVPVRLQVCASGDPGALIASDLLERILDNLIDNALRFSSPGGVIALACGFREGRPVVTVEDEGPGVPLEAQEAIFSAYRAHPRSEGNHFGLGLTFCRAVARAYGGDVRVENRSQGGARFVVEVG